MPQVGSQVRPRSGGISIGLSIKIALSAFLLTILWRRVPFADVSEVLSRAQVAWVLVAISLYVGSHVLNAVRWSRYSRHFGVPSTTALAARYYFAGLFLNLFAAGTVVGDLSRGLALADGRNRAASLAGVVAHRLSGMVALTMIAGAAGLLQQQYPLSAVLTVACWAVPLAATVTLLFSPSLVIGILAGFGREYHAPPDWLRATSATLVAAVLYHGLQVSSVLCLARAIGVAAPASTLSLFVPLVNFAGMIPVTVSGVGVREAGYVVLLGLVGVARDDSLAIGLLGTLLVFAAGLAGLPAFLKTRKDNRSEPD